MKKLSLLIAPLMSIAFLASCGPRTYTIDFQGENCSSTLTATQYHTGDLVSFNVVIDDESKFILPDKINVSGVSEYEYSKKYGRVSFTIENKDVFVVVNAEAIRPIRITFDGAGGYFNNIPTETMVDVETPYGQIPVAPIPKKIVAGTTSTFKGWDKPLEPAKPASESGITTYKALWDDVTNKCHVTFDANGGTITKDGDPVDIDYGRTITTAPIATRDGYGETIGWYDASTDGNEFIFGTTEVKTNLTLYAHWGDIKTYTVIFDADGGVYPASEGGQETVTRNDVPYNTTPTIPAAPTKIDPDGIKAYTFTGYDKNVAPVTGDDTAITYTAQWKETILINYSLIVNGNGGHFPDGDVTKTLLFPAETNIKSIATTLLLIYDDLNEVKTVDKFVYDNGEEIKDNDVLSHDGISIKATYRNKTLEECSWDEISRVSHKGATYAESYFGSITSESPIEKTVVVNGQPHKVRIIGYGQDVDAAGDSIGITFEFANLISDENGYSLASLWYDTNSFVDANFDYLNSTIRKNLTGQGNGYVMWYEKECSIRSSRSQTVLDMLPFDLRNVLKIAKKKVNLRAKATDPWVETEFNDKLFLLASKEIGFSGEYVESGVTTYKFYEGHTEQSERIRIKRQVKGHDGAITMSTKIIDNIYGSGSNFAGYDSNGGGSWLRSPHINAEEKGYYQRAYCIIGASGGVSYAYCVYNCADGIAPAFCV